MKPTRCNNCKLFFDADLYQQCPHCQADVTVAPPFANEKSSQPQGVEIPVHMPIQPVQPPVKPVKEHRFGFGKKKKAQEMNNIPPVAVNNVAPAAVPAVEATVSVSVQEKNDESTQIVVNDIPKPDENIQEKDSLRKAIQNTDSMQKTVAFYNLPNENEPVVGWLVCVKGEYIGESFKLKSGRNNIGRSLTMDVPLAKERSVSREKHASILYEPNKMQFFLQPGESSGLTYLNDELLMAFNELKYGDKVSLGDCSFIFVPLCGKDFNWDKYIEN